MIRHLVPRRLITLVRFYMIFNWGHGHSRVEKGFCRNGQGEPMPWITYPCLEFLNNLNFSDCRVFEYATEIDSKRSR